MSASLIEQLADHLNLERAEAEDALAALTARLNEEIEETGEATWPGLGRFHTDEAGLLFEPDETLALAVNQRYAGLKAVAVGGAGASFRNQEVVSPEPEPTEPTTEDTVPPAAPDHPETDELEADELEADDLDEDRGWQPPEASDEDHPLGPLPRQPFEEADFSVLAGFDETRERTEPSESTAEPDPDEADSAPEKAEADRVDSPIPSAEYNLTDADDEEIYDEDVSDDADLAATGLPPEDAARPGPKPPHAADDEPPLVPERDVAPEEPVSESSPFFEEWSESDFDVAEEDEDDELLAETEPLEPATELRQPDEPEPEASQEEDVELEPATAQANAEDVEPDVEPAVAPDANEEDREQAALVPPAVTPKPEPADATTPPAAATAEPATREPASRPSRSAAPRSAREDVERSRTPQILGGVLAVVLVLLLGLWLFSGDDGEIEDGGPPLTEQSTPPEQTPSDENTPAAGDAADEASPEADPPPAQVGVQDTPENQETGPEGAVSSEGSLTTIDRDTGAWTLVVASWTIESRAREEAAQYAEQFRSQGHPVDILHHTEDGVTRHRVAVGQFPDQEAAEAARANLSSLPEGVWLLRVRPGM